MSRKMSASGADEDFQVPLMNVFRAAAEAHDDKESDAQDGDDDRQISQRTIERRMGTSNAKLRDYLLADLANLMATVHLEALEEDIPDPKNPKSTVRQSVLAEFPLVRKSILNYGVEDISSLTLDRVAKPAILKRFREALITHEPRLIPDTVEVKFGNGDAANTQKVSFDVQAVMAARPVDVPLEFVAEIDVAEGKVFLSKLSVSE
ncbi:MAG: GPW/gp25 family protein [Pseudomonadota bacterium]